MTSDLLNCDVVFLCVRCQAPMKLLSMLWVAVWRLYHYDTIGTLRSLRYAHVTASVSGRAGPTINSLENFSPSSSFSFLLQRDFTS